MEMRRQKKRVHMGVTPEIIHAGIASKNGNSISVDMRNLEEKNARS